jgi:chromosome partitioning protein
VVDEVRRHFGERVYNTVIPRTVRLSEAPSFGKSILEYDSSSVGASAYRALAREFIKRHSLSPIARETEKTRLSESLEK